MRPGLKTQTSAARATSELRSVFLGGLCACGTCCPASGRGAPCCPRPKGPKASHQSHWLVLSPRLPRPIRGLALKARTSEQPP
jgi:hypothetical protein